MNALEELAPLRPLPVPPDALSAVRHRANRRNTRRRVALASAAVVASGCVAGVTASVVTRLTSTAGDRIAVVQPSPTQPSPVPSTGLTVVRNAGSEETKQLTRFPPYASSFVSLPLPGPAGVTRSLDAWYAVRPRVFCGFERPAPPPTSEPGECRDAFNPNATSDPHLVSEVAAGPNGNGWLLGVVSPQTVRVSATTPTGVQLPVVVRRHAGWPQPFFVVDVGPQEGNIKVQLHAYDASGRLIGRSVHLTLATVGADR